MNLVTEEKFSAMVADGRISNTLVAVAELWREGLFRPEETPTKPKSTQA